MKSDRVSIVLAFGIILAVLLSVNAVWATPEQSADRQTVPTKTPTESMPVSPPKEKDTPTPVPPTITATPTLVPRTPLASRTLTLTSTQTLTGTLASATVIATPTESPEATDTAVPPTQTVAPPPASSTPVATESSLPVPTVAATAATLKAPAGNNWLLWGIGLILIVGGAVLVFVRPGRKSA